MADRYENPCKNCSHRSYDCHTKCFQYKEWKNNEEAYKQYIEKQKSAYKDYNQYKYKQNAKYRHIKEIKEPGK